MMPSAANATILIIEDDAVAAAIFEHVLRTQGYAVRVTPDANGGLLALEDTIPSAILLDLHLPTIQGTELLRQIRALAPFTGVPTAVITGDYLVEEQLLEELNTLNAKLCFKPLWDEDLVRLVAELVSKD